MLDTIFLVELFPKKVSGATSLWGYSPLILISLYLMRHYLKILWETNKMAFGSYIRFGLGALISAIIIWSYLNQETVSPVLAILAVVYLVLAALWIVFRF